MAEPEFDVLIVGAGLSGIGMAAHLEMKVPAARYTILERRDRIGGTWDLFRYPGIRSDSDMHTLGFEFEPWTHEKSIADGPAILEYLDRIADERGIRPHIQHGITVISADFNSAEAMWHIVVEAAGQRRNLTARWLHLGSGYYDYDDPHDAGFDFSEFAGQVVHPQFWPSDLDYTGKEVVVIGSGATAVTLVPAMTDKAACVTMLQRTPTWMGARPAKDAIANFLRCILPDKTAFALTRAKNIFIQDWFFKRARNHPDKVKHMLKKALRKALGPDYDDATFTPPYDPWDQRLCLVPDNDLFEAMRANKARIVTGQIKGFANHTVKLTDGRNLPADIVVTATGLRLSFGGKIALSLNGAPVDVKQHFFYKGCMFSNLPNLSVAFGYLNASWTLRVDLTSNYICGVLNEMARHHAQIAYPALNAEAEAQLDEDDPINFSSAYLLRGKHLIPRSAVNMPWRLNQNYRQDRSYMTNAPVDDGILVFENVFISGKSAAVV